MANAFQYLWINSTGQPTVTMAHILKSNILSGWKLSLLPITTPHFRRLKSAVSRRSIQLQPTTNDLHTVLTIRREAQISAATVTRHQSDASTSNSSGSVLRQATL